MWRDWAKDWTINLSTGFGFDEYAWQGDWGSDGPINVGDLNGDGLTDVFMWRGDVWTVNISTGSGFAPAEWAGYPGDGPMVIGDVNGDHKTDAVVWNGSDNTWHVNISTGSGWSPQMWTGAWGSDGPINVGDLNGDGLTDVFMWRDWANDWTVNISTGSGFSGQVWDGDWGSDGPINVGDLNGDGLSDVFMWRGDVWTVNISTGSGFAPAEWSGLPGTPTVHVGDVNNDHMADVFMLSSPGQSWAVDISYGSGFYGQSWPDGAPQPFPADGNFLRIRSGNDQLWGRAFYPSIGTTEMLVPYTDLGDAYDKCEDGLFVDYQGGTYEQSSASEVHVFALDPGRLATSLGPTRFQQLAASPDPGVLPAVAVLPYPPSDGTQPVTVQLASGTFWGSNGPTSYTNGGLVSPFCQPVATPRAWVGGTDIAAVAAFQHGACSQTEPMTAVLTQVVSGVYSNFSSQVGHARRNYLEAESFVVRPGLFEPSGSGFPTNDPYDVHGGFDLTFDFFGDYAGVTNEVGADYHFYFGLRDGVVSADTFVSHGIWDNGVWGWAFADKIQTGLEQSLPQSFFLNAQAVQARPLPNLSPSCTVVDDCNTAAGELSAGITLDSMSTAGFVNPTTADLARLQCAVGNDGACNSIGATPQFTKRWICVPPGSSQSSCEYVVPVKRINAMEDQIEAVLFDGPELDNGAYGLVVASGATPDAQASTITQMCTATWPTAPLTRSFTLVTQ
jgi:hypothetical protein